MIGPPEFKLGHMDPNHAPFMPD